ncbi:MAG: zf-HC2 domain-containing protein [Polyangiaceae bacterium]
MNCEVMTRGDLEAYVFNETDGAESRRVESHLFGCAECAAEMRRLREERRLFRSRAEAMPAEVPSFEDVLARIDAGGGQLSREPEKTPHVTAAQAISEEAMSARASSREPGFSGDRARRLPVSARSSRGVGVTSAVLALAAAFVGLWMRTTPPPIAESTSPAPTQEALIAPEPTCDGTEDETVRVPISEEPTASIDPSLRNPPVPVPPSPPLTTTCESDTCLPTAEVASSCESCAAFCAPTEP